MRSFFLALLSTLALAANAGAQPSGERLDLIRDIDGVIYFNRPGADLAAQDKAMLGCIRQYYSGKIGPNGLPAQAGRTAFRLVFDPPGRAAVTNCMVVDGWRVFQLEGSQAQAATRLQPAALRSQLAQWVGQEQPPGRLVRRWNNDAMHGGVIRNNSITLLPKSRMLPLDSMPESLQRLGLSEVLKDMRGPQAWRWPKALKASQPASLPPDRAIIVVHILNGNFSGGASVVLERLEQGPPPADRAGTFINAGIGTLFAKDSGDTLAFEVAPGRWRLASIGVDVSGLDFCLGAPAFDVAAGEVVYAGSFDFKADRLGPVLDPETPRADLRAWGELAGRLKPARYENGVIAPCRARAIYALEIPGAPTAAGGRRFPDPG